MYESNQKCTLLFEMYIINILGDTKGQTETQKFPDRNFPLIAGCNVVKLDSIQTYHLLNIIYFVF